MAQGFVTIFGGSGFLGRHIVQRLAQAGYRVRVATRKPSLANHLMHRRARSARSRSCAATFATKRDVAAAVVGRRIRDQSRRHPATKRRQNFQCHARRRRRHDRTRGGQGRRSPPHPRLGDRRRQGLAFRLRAFQGRGRNAGARSLSRRHDPAPLDRFRSGRRLLQPALPP